MNGTALARDAPPPSADGMCPAFPVMGVTVDLDGMPDSYRATNDPEAIKVMIRP